MFAPPPGFEAAGEKPTGKLSENETEVILRATLDPLHRDDPNILRWLSNYLRCRDARQAAREAGLHPNAGTNLRQKPDIHRAIEAITLKSVNKYGFDAAELVERVKEIAVVDPLDLQNPDGSWKIKLCDIPPEARRAIKKMKVRNMHETDPNGMRIVVGEIIDIEFWDKMKGIELLGREKNTFTEKKIVEHGVTDNMKELLLGSSEKADRRLAAVRDVTPQVTGGFDDAGES